VAEHVHVEAVQVGAQLLVDRVLGRPPGLGRVEVARRRPAVLAVEVPAPALRLAVLGEQDPKRRRCSR
jgi:hypothetical protein